MDAILGQQEPGGGDTSWAFLGQDSLAWIILAFGAAMVIGNVLALVRPPAGQSERPPILRTVVMMGIGALAALWGAASLIS